MSEKSSNFAPANYVRMGKMTIKSKRNHIMTAIRKHRLVSFVVLVLVLFGLWSLPHMNKDEFPQFTIRQGVVAAVYPGATAQEVEDQVTKRLERYLFTFPEVSKSTTFSVTEDGVAYIYADLRVEVTDKDEVWSKIKHGLNLFKQTDLPPGVLAIVVVDDFGNTSSMLLAVESSQRTPRELEAYSLQVCDRLRTIPEMGKVKIEGTQQEEIALTVDIDKAASYGIHPDMLLGELALQGLRTTGGEIQAENGVSQIHVEVPYRAEYELGEQIIYSDPATGQTIRLRDIATIERRYEKAKKYIEHYEAESNVGSQGTDGASCVLINIEMMPGRNIVAFGEKVEKILDEQRALLPPDVRFHRITDQPKVVSTSVMSFLRDLMFSIVVVILVMLVLFPLRTALVSSTGVPVCTAVCVGLMYLTGIELNTVTLAALIVVLGMIVDDSVIVIDGYSDLLDKGHSRGYAAVESTSMLFIPMSLATCAIAGMFFPMTRIITGPLGEFVQLFPWAVSFALTASIFYAVWVIPYLSIRFIRKRSEAEQNRFERGQNRFFAFLQNLYHDQLTRCFRHPWLTLGAALCSLALGLFLFSHLNIQMLPKAERECFAVEIHLPAGSSLEETAFVADSMARVLNRDKRVRSVTSFVGQASPRFHATYTPQMAAPNYAQFIVNTTSQHATAAILKEYTPLYEDAFPNAYVRFKQMDYQPVKNPLEVRLEGPDLDELVPLADSIKAYMAGVPELHWAHTDYEDFSRSVTVRLKPDEATRLGITQTQLSLYLNRALGGQQLTTVWEDDYRVPVMLYVQGSDTVNCAELEEMLVPTVYPGVWVPVRQVATIEPSWHHSSITRRNSIRSLTVGADLRGKEPQPRQQKKLEKYVDEHIRPQMPADATISYGGLTAMNNMVIPQLVWSVVAALMVLLVLVIWHFGKLGVAVLTLSTSMLCIFGACLGLYIFRLDFSITALLGLVSLIGIIVRNAIIMYEYAEQLRKEKLLSAREAAYEAGLRRMRPIFLTSATTALGVVPMIVAHTSLWMPMGVVICFGTIFTLPLVVTVLPIAYWKVFDHA